MEKKIAAEAVPIVALVTGANKGIGLAIVESLAAKRPTWTIILGSRSLSRAEEARATFSPKVQSQIDVVQLDLDSEDSVKQAADYVKERYAGLDVLVNNAGMAFKGSQFNDSVARQTIDTNYGGTLRVVNHFLPLMKAKGKIVNVSSRAGRLSKLSSSQLVARFLEPNLTIEQLNALLDEFVAHIAADTYEKNGWPKNTYAVSKIGMSMLTRILARDHPELIINACCPGWVRTDMAGPNAPLTPAQGAETPVHLALLDENGKTGRFWYDLEDHDWE
jgi:carbonyl reductase 1